MCTVTVTVELVGHARVSCHLELPSLLSVLLVTTSQLRALAPAACICGAQGCGVLTVNQVCAKAVLVPCPEPHGDSGAFQQPQGQ